MLCFCAVSILLFCCRYLVDALFCFLLQAVRLKSTRIKKDASTMSLKTSLKTPAKIFMKTPANTPVQTSAKSAALRVSTGPLSGLVLAFGLLAGLSVPSGAQVAIFNTGQSATATPLAGGAIDTHWTIITPSTGAASNAIVLGNNNHYNEWDNNDAASAWIGFSDAQNTLSAAGKTTGTYYLHTTFNLAGFTVGTATLSGQFREDDSATDILLNGQSLTTAGVSGLNVPGPAAWRNYTPFSYGGGLFQSGVNTLDFVVNFGDDNFDAGRVRNLSVTATPAAVPEPGSMALLVGVTVSAAGFLGRRKRRAA